MNLSAPVKERVSARLAGTHTWLVRQLDDQKPKGTIAVLDGVRAIACILVVVYHSTSVIYDHISNKPFLAALNYFGAKGVSLFFVLSGFLLFLPYAQALLFEKRWPQARMFYLRRILRIVPGYYFALFAILLLEKPSYLQIGNWRTVFSFLTFFMTSQQSSQVNGSYWTLAVEFQYYMLLPLIALGIYGLARLVHPQQRLWVVISSLLAMIAWGLATRRWGDALFARPDSQAFLATHPILKYIAILVYDGYAPNYNTSGKFLEDFAVGMLLVVCYIVVTNASRGDTYRRILLRLCPWLWWVGIAILGFATWRNASFLPNWPVTFRIFDAYPNWAIDLAFAIGFGCCILAILFNGTGILKRCFEWTPLRWVGIISFSLYLWHDPIIAALGGNVAPSLLKYFSAPVATGIYVMLECVMVISVSFIMYVLVEKPGMRLSARLRHKNLTPREQKTPASPTNTRSRDEEFDLEKTEPRQAVVLTETSHH